MFNQTKDQFLEVLHVKCLAYFSPISEASLIRIKLSDDLFIDVKGFDSLTGSVQANYEPLKEAVPFYGLATRIEFG